MANTITQTTLHGSGSDKMIIKSIHILSDGSEETDLVVYDNSAFVADTSKGSVMKVIATGDSCICRLEWDQTADSHVISVNPSAGTGVDFSDFGGITNPGGTGATGDLLLTTAALDSADEVTLIIYIKQS